jgi:hypothetical protein
MKAVDMDTVSLVHSGEAWRHQQPPCSRQMIQHLEKNEGVVTWVQVCFLEGSSVCYRLTCPTKQPKAGTVLDQFPVIRIGDKYFTMSLRMMKAVWWACFCLWGSRLVHLLL